MGTSFGIDFGGSGIKGAPVDLIAGELLTERMRIPTPQPSSPDAVMDVIAKIVTDSGWKGPVGCTFPAVVRNGVVHNATFIDNAWIGFNAHDALRSRLKAPVSLLNDADAAGIAEMRFGAGQRFREHGVVLMLTFGTGIGSAIFVDGHLMPNTELGDLELDGQSAETRAAGRLQEDGILTWETWIQRVQRFLSHVELLLWPDLIIFGGGISEHSDRFIPELKTRALLVPAQLRNNAGIVGAAYAADQLRGG